jgi:N-methylhydantoinase A
MTRNTRLAVDVGGTFTDVVKLDTRSGELLFDKVPTTPEAPTKGVLEAFARASADVEDIEMFNHGTTLGLNALLTRRGARVAIIGTRGFRDIYLLGRTDRKGNFNIKYRKPKALVERYDTFEVTERSTFEGKVHTPFDEADALRVARAIVDGGYESVAVAFLHSYVNPDHELRMREVIRKIAPDMEVTLSHEMSREYREYERTSTAVLDAYIKPIVRGYLAALQDELEAQGFGGRFLMTRSGGGSMTAALAKNQPVNLILSGPAGGVIGAAEFARLTGRPNLITIDMGGTSLDASLIIDESAVLYQGAEFEGLPINSPSLYIHTIGAGGGSIAWLDEAGALQVGPQSAGADPGPASYLKGGTQPTFTDAALVLGYLGTETPLGGSLTLDKDAAYRALEPLAAQLGMSVNALARGIIRISVSKIMGAVRAITVELGRDPKDFALLSFGGGGGLVGVDVAAELSIPTVIIPPGQGAFCAFGMLMANVQHDFARTNVQLLAQLDSALAEERFVDMESEARSLLAAEGFDPMQQELVRTVDVRYAGQEHTVTLPYPPVETVTALSESFAHEHEQKYGHSMDDPVEITTLRLRATGFVGQAQLPKHRKRSKGESPHVNWTRSVYLADGVSADYRVFVREELMAGDVISGPAVIAEHTATTVIHKGDILAVGEYGELIIDVRHHIEGASA